MENLSSASLSTAGRPILLTNEVELKSENNVSVPLQDGRKVIGELLSSGYVLLTNFRLIFIVQSSESSTNLIGWSLDLKLITSVDDCARLFRHSTRMQLSLEGDRVDIGLRFERDGKEEFFIAIQKALEKRSWEKYRVDESVKGPTKDETVFSSSNAGVAGIMRRQERNMQSVDNLAKSALTDLDALMLRAREAIEVVQRYASYTAANDMKDDTISETTTQINEKNEMENIMQNIGIISPVTKYSAGQQYHEQLARQIIDILLSNNRIERLGGMITLTDLYCVFNRARGTELVSPDDLYKASLLMNKLKLNLSLRIFDSGVKVLQLNTYNENIMLQNIVRLLNNKEYNNIGVQASDIAINMNISLILAKEYLLLGEGKGLICRDECIQGKFFFLNLFETSNWGIHK